MAGQAATGIGGAPILNSLVPIGENQVVNSDLNQGLNGFEFVGAGGTNFTGTGLSTSSGRNLVNTPNYFGARNVFWSVATVSSGHFTGGTYLEGFRQLGISGPTVSNLRRYATQVIPGERIYYSARIAVHGMTTGVVQVNFYDRDGVYLSTSSVSSVIGDARAAGPTGQLGLPSNFAFLGTFATVPANAVFAAMSVSGNTLSGAQSSAYVFACDYFIAKVSADQTVAPAYNPGPVDRAADRTNENTAASFLGQGNRATTNVYRQASAPASPVQWDEWQDTSTAPVIIKLWISGSWVPVGEEGATVGSVVGNNFRFPDGSIAPIGRVDNALNAIGVNRIRDAGLQRQLQYRSLAWNTVPGLPTMTFFADVGVGGFVSMTTPNVAALGSGNFYGLVMTKAQNYAESSKLAAGRVAYAAKVNVPNPSAWNRVWLRCMLFNGLGVWYSSSEVDYNLATGGIQNIGNFFDVSAAIGGVLVVWGQLKNTVSTAQNIDSWEPILANVPSGQTALPIFSVGTDSDAGADRTGENTAAAITGQGNNATRNTTAGTLASRPTGADGDSYHATDTREMFYKIGGSWVKVADVANTFNVSLSTSNITVTGAPGTLTTGSVTATVTGGSGSYNYAWAVITKDVQSLNPFMTSQSATSACRAALGSGQAVSGTIQLTVTDTSTGAIQIRTLTYSINTNS